MPSIGKVPNLPLDFVPKGMIWRCPASHKTKAMVLGQKIVVVPCQKCKKAYGAVVYPREMFFIPSLDDPLDLDIFNIETSEPEVIVKEIVREAGRYDQGSFEFLLAMLNANGVRMGNGQIGRLMCKSCENQSHSKRFKKCSCPCHAAWEYVERVESERGAEKSAQGEGK